MLVDKNIEGVILEMEETLNEISNTVDTQKYPGIGDVLKTGYIELNNTRIAFSNGNYEECIKIKDRTMKKIDKEFVKVIEDADKTVKGVTNWSRSKTESLLAQETDYNAMSREETTAEIDMAGNISGKVQGKFKAAEGRIEKAEKALDDGDYKNVIKYSEEAIEKVENVAIENIRGAEQEIKEIRETKMAYGIVPLVFSVDTSCVKGDPSCPDREIGTAKRRLQSIDCGAMYTEDCPDYSAAIFWSEHARGLANEDIKITTAKNIVIAIMVLVALFIIIQWYRGREK